jgi:hypothetical protein
MAMADNRETISSTFLKDLLESRVQRRARGMSDQTNGISGTELHDAIRRSGYLLEGRVYDLIRRRKEYVEANVAYPDPVTGKSRELDVYAMRGEKAGPGRWDYLFRVLVIECVNNPQPVAFFTREPVVDYFDVSQIKLAGLPVKIPARTKRNQWISLPEWLEMDRYHHYRRGRVATQFCSFIRKGGQKGVWMATHLEDQFDSFRKLCVAVEHYREKHFESWTFRGHESINVELYYPVLILQGEMMEIRRSKASFKTIIADHVLFHQSVWTGKEQEDYCIDVITESYLPTFLRLSGMELVRTARRLRSKYKEVRASVDRLTRMGRRLRSPLKIRELLEL